MTIFDRLTGTTAYQSYERLIDGLVTARVSRILADGTFELSYLSLGDDEASAPARAMMPSAGGGRGIHFMPEPGDEVIVAFERGNPNLPVILGSVWNDDNGPPRQANASPDNNVRTIVSRAGHELTFDDSSGGERVSLKTAGGREIVLDDSSKKIEIKTPRGVTIELSDSGALTIQTSGAMSVRARSISMQAGSISLTTTGVATTSAVTIDGTPFGAHVHPGGTLPSGTTGPVKP